MNDAERECRELFAVIELAKVREMELEARNIEADRVAGELKEQLSTAENQLQELKSQVESLNQELQSKTSLIQDQQESAAKQVARENELVQKLAALEDKHTFLLDMTKDKDSKLTELQLQIDALIKENRENEQQVRELVGINAELMDVAETSKRTETLIAAKDEQIRALQTALSEASKLADLRRSECERMRQETEQLRQANAELNVKVAGSKSEVILKIELEKLKETLSREKKLNDLRVIDLEEQVESLREELAKVKDINRRLSLAPTDQNDTENIDPFREAKEKLAQLNVPTNSNNTVNNTFRNQRVMQKQDTPAEPQATPQECLQQ